MLQYLNLDQYYTQDDHSHHNIPFALLEITHPVGKPELMGTNYSGYPSDPQTLPSLSIGLGKRGEAGACTNLRK